MGIILLSVAGLTGCSAGSTTAGSATTEKSSSSSTTQSTDSSIPKALNPVDVSKLPDACNLLTTSDESTFSVGTGYQNGTKGLPGCGWKALKNGSVIALAFIRGNGGISHAYKLSESGQSGLFQPIDAIDGLPAVMDGAIDSRKSGVCDVIIGITDNDVIATGVVLVPESSKYSDPCSVAINVSKAAVANLRKVA
jgi:hypothetical protein